MTALRLLLLLVAGSVCACGALTPYASAPAPALPVAGVVDPRQRVGICANPLKSSPEQIQQVAQTECLGNTVAQQITGGDYRLDVCPLAVPARITFACIPKK